MTSTTAHPLTTTRRTTLAGAATLGVLVTTAACGGGSGDGPAADTAYEAPSSDLEARITYGLWDQAQVAGLQRNIDAFTAKFPGVEVAVNVTPFSEYWTKLQTQASSDTLPDLFWMNGPNFQLYAANGKIAPITGAVEAGDIDPANYPSALVDLYSLDGVTYGVPKDFDTIGVWVNTDLFARAGVGLPTAEWTWDEFQDTAVRISQALSAQGVFGAAGGMDGQTTYYNTIFEAGGEVVADGKSGYASTDAVAGLQFWTDLIASGGSPSIQQLTDTTADQWFTSGKLAMYWGGSWFRAALTDTDLAGKVQVLPLPRGAQQVTVIHGVSNVVSASTKNRQAAQALQVFLAGQEAQQQLGSAGTVIPAFNGTQGTFASSMPGTDLQLFLDAVDYSKPLPVSENTAAWNALETDLLPDAFSGARPVGEVAGDLAQQMDEALADE
ncbi:extracellular solute-binding protein [Kineococcus aurantiacus]|uniref:Multiple sugar transport system substrate-binding protein n=1 Tax=Kineococcus aurantiacus TaxID=37633 RepID=A0A7Y9DJA9_9ACTN|nr:multiple sugar transport system substrate-binding protein [Kineococcus aurantiacus]